MELLVRAHHQAACSRWAKPLPCPTCVYTTTLLHSKKACDLLDVSIKQLIMHGWISVELNLAFGQRLFDIHTHLPANNEKGTSKAWKLHQIEIPVTISQYSGQLNMVCHRKMGE